jgi:hypothetical protein
MRNWEWRTFMPQTDVEQKISQYPLTWLSESLDVYILSELSMDNIKVRDNFIKIKMLQLVAKDGLEQWQLVKREPFPLPLAEVQAISRVYRVPMPEFAKDTYSFEEFVELATKDERIICVVVDKNRRLYDVDDCLVEVADLKFGDKTIITMAIESENPDKVRATKTLLGLDGLENVNYVTAIKRMYKK